MIDQRAEIEEIETFCEEIERMTGITGSYIDSIVLYAEKSSMEVELLASLISPSLKSKLKQEGENIKMLKPATTKRLPI